MEDTNTIIPDNPARRPVGRPADVKGKRVQVYLDAESLRAAAILGFGNVSEGIRKALKQAGSHPSCPR